MANVKPLINSGGEFSTAQTGDVIDPAHGGTGQSSYTPYTVSETPPPSPNPGDRWVKPSTGKKYEWYDDGSSTQWVELDSVVISGPSVQTYIQETAPEVGGQFVWYQIGLGEDGTGFTIWFEDGQ